jgi:hypothetical protein
MWIIKTINNVKVRYTRLDVDDGFVTIASEEFVRVVPKQIWILNKNNSDILTSFDVLV